jgi:hypothetical protein
VPNCKKLHGERRLEEDALAAAVLQDESTVVDESQSRYLPPPIN